ncbi:hypothetical protein NV379_02310 [Paenibacillus sp. N1-5-1-14]|uniref:hypothetical protein n=1 Tax=Paenibacillus radicibacter TaxID=2972488 RepID=UPI002158B0D8|nr:hypothetical protein [Paenibacillus radicibacter]MCR8641480.1 hypothetical protein [Paenibacillus radicibacter]
MKIKVDEIQILWGDGLNMAWTTGVYYFTLAQNHTQDNSLSTEPIKIEGAICLIDE